MKKNLSRICFAVLCVFILTIMVSCAGGPKTPKYKKVLAYTMIKPRLSKELRYTDDVIDIKFIIGAEFIGFELHNKKDVGIKIKWDDCSYVSPSGETMRIIHSGVKLIDRDKPQAPTTIPPGAKIVDQFVPTGNIYWDTTSNVWHTKPLHPYKQGWLTKSFPEPETYAGKTFTVYMPIEFKNLRGENSFVFKINVETIPK